jgi:hypothetical protein
MSTRAIGVPSVKGMGHAFKKFAWGLGGGLGFMLLYSLFGPLGVLAAPVIIGAAFKGDEGEDIAFMSGFLVLALGALSSGFGSGGSATNTGSNGVAV